MISSVYTEQGGAAYESPEQFLTSCLGCTLDNLPTLPDVAMRIMQLAGSDDHTAKELAHEIGQDPSLASRVLRAANSPYFGYMSEIEDLNRAVVLMGFDEVRNIAMGIAAFESVRTKRALRRRMQRNNLWAHSQHVGMLAELLGKHVLGLGTGYYVFGLIHDIGKVALDAHRPDEFDRVLDIVSRGRLDWITAEREIMGIDHSLVGGALLEYWNFPPNLVAAAAGHHEPWNMGDKARSAGAVFVADILAQIDKFNVGGAPKSLPKRLPLNGPVNEFLANMGWRINEQTLELIGDLLRESGGDFEPVNL